MLRELRIECEPFRTTNGRKHRIAHTWLKRQVFPLLFNQQNEPKRIEDDWSELLALLLAWHNETKDFAQSIIDGYSPRQLVCHGPLWSFPEETKTLVASLVHEAYLSTSTVVQSSIRICEAIAKIDLVVNQLSERQLQSARDGMKNDLSEAILELKTALDSLPEGIVLP